MKWKVSLDTEDQNEMKVEAETLSIECGDLIFRSGESNTTLIAAVHSGRWISVTHDD